jgi:hypothetical protein
MTNGVPEELEFDPGIEAVPVKVTMKDGVTVLATGIEVRPCDQRGHSAGALHGPLRRPG